MRTSEKPNHSGRWLGAMLAALAMIPARGETDVFMTRFEASEGYNGDFTLAGQQDWVGEGTGGNGIVTNLIAGQGQQAYIGYFPPLSTNETESFVWRPIDFDPRAAGRPIVRFSVLMSVEDSSFDSWDNFRWSVYNAQTNRLFSLDFDNYYRDVSYLLDGTNDLVVTPVTLTNGTPYVLLVTMNFASNRWSATLDNRLITTNQPITTVNAELSLGDIDAVWSIFDPQFPGDNYLLFDNYQITADAPTPPRPRLTVLGRASGQTLLRLTGPSGERFALEASTNFTTWTSLKTNVTSAGSFDYIDVSATGSTQRFYRARWVP